DGIRDRTVTEFRRVLFRSSTHPAGSIPSHRNQVQQIMSPEKQTNSYRFSTILTFFSSLPDALNWKPAQVVTRRGTRELITRNSSHSPSTMAKCKHCTSRPA